MRVKLALLLFVVIVAFASDVRSAKILAAALVVLLVLARIDQVLPKAQP